jgi:trigger factor
MTIFLCKGKMFQKDFYMIKNIDIKELEEGILEIVTVVDKDIVQTYYQKALAKVQNQAKIKGFREGKAPLNLIIKTYDPQIRLETINTLFSPLLEIIRKDHHIIPIAAPDIKGFEEHQWGDDLSLTLTVETMPEVKDLPSLDSITPDKVEFIFDEEQEINKEIEMLQGLHTHYHDLDKGASVALENFVRVEYQIKGEEVPETKENQFFILKESDPLFEISKHFIGKQIGQSYQERVSFSDSFQNEALRSKDVTLEFKLLSAKYMHKPEVNDEFAKSFGFETLDLLKQSIKVAILKKIQIKTLNKNATQVFEALAAKAQFSISQKILMSQTQSDMQSTLQMLISQQKTFEQYIAEKGLNEDNFMDAMAKESKEGLEKYLISQKLMEQFDISSTDEETNTFLEEVVDMEVANQEELKNYYRSHEKAFGALKDRLNMKKLAKVLMEKVKFGKTIKIDLKNSREDL